MGPSPLLYQQNCLLNGVGCEVKALEQSPWETKDIALQPTDPVRPQSILYGFVCQATGFGDVVSRHRQMAGM